jgi:hypothetical protein
MIDDSTVHPENRTPGWNILSAVVWEFHKIMRGLSDKKYSRNKKCGEKINYTQYHD